MWRSARRGARLFNTSVPRFADDVVTGGENVRGVEANTKPLRLARVGDDVSDLFEGVAETRALAGGRFQSDFRFHLPHHAEHGVERRHDLVEACLFACAEV